MYEGIALGAVHELEVLCARLTKDRFGRHCCLCQAEDGEKVRGGGEGLRLRRGLLSQISEQDEISIHRDRALIDRDHGRLLCHTPGYIITSNVVAAARRSLPHRRRCLSSRQLPSSFSTHSRLIATYTHSEPPETLLRGFCVHRHVRRCSGSMFAEVSPYTCFPLFPRPESPDTVSISTSHQKVVLDIDFSGSLWVRGRRSCAPG